MAVTNKFECYLCKKTINLHDAKTDDQGRAVHEECYVATLWHPPVRTHEELRTYGLWQYRLGGAKEKGS